ncbi:transposase, partial [Streptomyces sp. NPDC091377]|uniref:transposase n=1 Tax=Streptomyces sp. NPDC091377 TaxID=3365995 RepID=UPI0038045EBA
MAQTALVVPRAGLSSQVVHRADPAGPGRRPADREAAQCGRAPDTGRRLHGHPGSNGQTPLTAWIAKESLRTLLGLARTGADRHRIGHARYKFLTWCSDADIPEVRTLATIVDRWWNEVAAFIDTGHGNAKSEGINRVIKFV